MSFYIVLFLNAKMTTWSSTDDSEYKMNPDASGESEHSAWSGFVNL